MLHKAIAAVIVARLVLAPWAAAEDSSPRGLPPTAIRDTAAREAAALTAQPPARGPTRPGLKWTGIGLIIGGGMSIVTTAMGGCRSSERTCRNVRRAGYGVGAGMAGTGLLLIGMAHAKRVPVGPALVIDGDRAIVSQRVTF
jgi:hypothetical protein